MDAWRVVVVSGEPAAGLHVLAGAQGRARLVPVDPDGTVPLAPGERPMEVRDALGLREVAHRVDGARLVVDRGDAFGWAVRGAAVEDGNEVELLQDAEMFPPIVHAMDRARSTLHLSQLLFFKDFRAPFDGGDAPAGTLLGRLLSAAQRGVEVRILLNDNWIVPDSVQEVRDACEGRERVEVRAFPLSPNLLHAKLLVADGEEAFILGPPFEQRYWDTSAHPDHDPRRDDPRPLHDLSLRLRGPAVARVEAFFADLWASQGPPIARRAPPPRAGDQRVQIVSTLPQGVLDGSGWQARGAKEAYLRAFANAQDHVYLETQYFTSPSVTEAIAAALDARPRLQVVLVLNLDVDVPLYLRWQKRRLASLGHPRHPRLGVFTLFTPTPDPQRPRPVYVHSKLALADDAWASLGSANLDSLSLENGQEWGFEVKANVDLNAVLLDGVEDAPRTGLVAAIRRRVWAEHLGDAGVWTARRPDEGWLPLWRRIGDENLRALEEGRFPARGRILPYAPDDLPEVPLERPPRRRLAAEP